MAARLVGMPAWQFLDDQAAVLASGTLDFHEPGTSTDKSIWKDAGKATEHSNPITLDAGGRPPNPVFAEGLYDITVKDSSGTTIETISNWGDNFSSNSEQSPSVIKNWSFEDDDDADTVPDNWTFDNGTSGARITSDQIHGTACVKFTGTSSSSDTILSDYFEVSSNEKYEISFEYKTSNSACLPKLIVNEYDASKSANGTNAVWAPTSSSTSWAKVEKIPYTPDSGDFWAKLQFTANTAATGYDTYIDNVTVKVVPAIPDPTYIPNGLVLSRDTDTDHDINITSGSVKSDDFTEDMVLASEITKQADASWAAGDDAGGLFSGSSLPADGMIAVWLIKNPTTGDVDAGFDTSFSSPTLPAGYTVKRLIGGWITDASNNFIGGTHRGTMFIFHAGTEDVNDNTVVNNTENTHTVTCPPNCVYMFSAGLTVSTGNHSDFTCQIYNTNVSEPTAIEDAIMGMSIEVRSGSTRMETMMFSGQVLTDSSSQIHSHTIYDGTQPTLKISCYGWDMLTRNDP